ncbi:hypothetical protein K435DRAFT_558564, partial [Dendrothele bispora CBS 962.96]
IVNDRIYRHKVLRVNHTTYDMWRSQDSINPRTHPDIMVPSRDEGNHPYSYARIIGIFHATVKFTGLHGQQNSTQTHEIFFLWV